MDALVAERERGGPFASLEDFAARIDPEPAQPPPARKPGRGGRVRFGRARPRGGVRRRRDRSSPMRRARTTSAPAARRPCSAPIPAAIAPIRLKRDAPWSLAQRMAAERDAFGFYFSAHPVEAQRHLLAAHQVRRFASLAELRIARGRARGRERWPALVEDVRYRTSARGPALHDGDDERPQRPVRRHRVRGRRLRRARSRGQERAVRAADGRARQAAGRRAAAGDGQALPAARRPGQEEPAAADCAARAMPALVPAHRARSSTGGAAAMAWSG